MVSDRTDPLWIGPLEPGGRIGLVPTGPAGRSGERVDHGTLRTRPGGPTTRQEARARHRWLRSS